MGPILKMGGAGWVGSASRTIHKGASLDKVVKLEPHARTSTLKPEHQTPINAKATTSHTQAWFGNKLW